MKQTFIEEVKKFSLNEIREPAGPCTSTSRDDASGYFDFAKRTETQHVATADVTIKCLCFSEDINSTSLDILHKYPTINALFRYVNARDATGIPEIRNSDDVQILYKSARVLKKAKHKIMHLHSHLITKTNDYLQKLPVDATENDPKLAIDGLQQHTSSSEPYF